MVDTKKYSEFIFNGRVYATFSDHAFVSMGEKHKYSTPCAIIPDTAVDGLPNVLIMPTYAGSGLSKHKTTSLLSEIGARWQDIDGGDYARLILGNLLVDKHEDSPITDIDRHVGLAFRNAANPMRLYEPISYDDAPDGYPLLFVRELEGDES